MTMMRFSGVSGNEGEIYFSEVNDRFVRVAKVDMYTPYGSHIMTIQSNEVFSSVNAARNKFKKDDDMVSVNALVDYGNAKGIDICATAMEMCGEEELSDTIAIMLNFKDIKRALDTLEVE